MKTDVEVIKFAAKAIKQIDSVTSPNISGMDQFYIDTARELLLKVIVSSGFKLNLPDYRVQNIRKR